MRRVYALCSVVDYKTMFDRGVTGDPHDALYCVFEHDTLPSAYYWFNLGKVPK